MIEDLGVPVAITVKSTIKIVRSSIILQVRILLSFQKTDTNIFFFSHSHELIIHTIRPPLSISILRDLIKKTTIFKKKKKERKDYTALHQTTHSCHNNNNNKKKMCKKATFVDNFFFDSRGT